MALVRYRDHFPDPDKTVRDYAAVVEPVGYPDTAAICGEQSVDHEEPGYVLLQNAEYAGYLQGQRVFSPITDGTHIRVTDEVVEEL